MTTGRSSGPVSTPLPTRSWFAKVRLVESSVDGGGRTGRNDRRARTAATSRQSSPPRYRHEGTPIELVGAGSWLIRRPDPGSRRVRSTPRAAIRCSRAPMVGAAGRSGRPRRRRLGHGRHRSARRRRRRHASRPPFPIVLRRVQAPPRRGVRHATDASLVEAPPAQRRGRAACLRRAPSRAGERRRRRVGRALRACSSSVTPSKGGPIFRTRRCARSSTCPARPFSSQGRRRARGHGALDAFRRSRLLPPRRVHRTRLQSRAAYAFFDASLRDFQGFADHAVLGSGAGVDASDADDGLVRFKRGWGTVERSRVLGGRIVDADAYRRLVAS